MSDFGMTSIWFDPRSQQGDVRDHIYCVSRRTGLLINIVILHPVDAI
jgi:hypothetical protein